MERNRGGIRSTVDYDRDAQRVVINATDTVRAPLDSTVIVMVDRIDSVGGPPVVSSVLLPRVSPATVRQAPPPQMSRATYDSLLRAFVATGRVDNALSRFLATVPVVREFLRQ
jgi:hypothetical protein